MMMMADDFAFVHCRTQCLSGISIIAIRIDCSSYFEALLIRKVHPLNLIFCHSMTLPFSLRAAKALDEIGVPTTLILDSGAAYAMERVDMVLTGAEAVVENGGIVNKLGTYQIALCAKACNKPFYAAAESYKFARLYPLSQKVGHPTLLVNGPPYPLPYSRSSMITHLNRQILSSRLSSLHACPPPFLPM
jgi:hypothetical protein